MLDLWAELQRVRRQFQDLREQTERDLQTQRDEFNRTLRSIQGVTRAMSTGDVRKLLCTNIMVPMFHA